MFLPESKKYTATCSELYGVFTIQVMIDSKDKYFAEAKNFITCQKNGYFTEEAAKKAIIHGINANLTTLCIKDDKNLILLISITVMPNVVEIFEFELKPFVASLEIKQKPCENSINEEVNNFNFTSDRSQFITFKVNDDFYEVNVDEVATSVGSNFMAYETTKTELIRFFRDLKTIPLRKEKGKNIELDLIFRKKAFYYTNDKNVTVLASFVSEKEEKECEAVKKTCTPNDTTTESEAVKKECEAAKEIHEKLQQEKKQLEETCEKLKQEKERISDNMKAIIYECSDLKSALADKIDELEKVSKCKKDFDEMNNEFMSIANDYKNLGTKIDQFGKKLGSKVAKQGQQEQPKQGQQEQPKQEKKEAQSLKKKGPQSVKNTPKYEIIRTTNNHLVDKFSYNPQNIGTVHPINMLRRVFDREIYAVLQKENREKGDSFLLYHYKLNNQYYYITIPDADNFTKIRFENKDLTTHRKEISEENKYSLEDWDRLCKERYFYSKNQNIDHRQYYSESDSMDSLRRRDLCNILPNYINRAFLYYIYLYVNTLIKTKAINYFGKFVTVKITFEKNDTKYPLIEVKTKTNKNPTIQKSVFKVDGKDVMGYNYFMPQIRFEVDSKSI